ncbi:DASS family sodium-coupled anion symporter, partial [Flavobacterium sp. J27]|uniref:SLC13 family permease n=1 Tax=Flavobacterium sp. J27 TaxID=2060419 RepID=UPI00103088CC
MKLSKKKVGLYLGPLLFVLIQLFFKPEGLNQAGIGILASTVWVAIWWITEPIAIPVVSLLPIVLFPLSGGLSLSETTASYGHQYIFLFMGGFILAIAIEKWNLHKRIALTIIKIVGTNMNQIILGFMIATAFLSMWISNTATAVMILPVGIAVVKQLKDNIETKENENLLFGKMLMLAIAYSASIGGMATLIGTPPNLVLAGVVEKTYHTEITFLQWFMFGFPLSIILLYLCWLYLTKFAYKINQKEFPGGKQEIEKQLQNLGPVTYQEKMVFIVFLITAIAWISRSFLLVKLFPSIDDTTIAIVCSLILFLIPSKKNNENLMTWNDAVTLPWGILLLFGGGMALALGFEKSGLATWIGNHLTLLEGASILLLVLVLVTAINFLTEITSNMATTAMLLPVLVSLSLIIDVHPYILLVCATLAASCAFMLPVATPPNAVVFGSGYLKVEDMVKKGVWMNIISILIITLFGYYVL